MERGALHRAHGWRDIGQPQNRAAGAEGVVVLLHDRGFQRSLFAAKHRCLRRATSSRVCKPARSSGCATAVAAKSRRPPVLVPYSAKPHRQTARPPHKRGASGSSKAGKHALATLAPCARSRRLGWRRAHARSGRSSTLCLDSLRTEPETLQNRPTRACRTARSPCPLAKEGRGDRLMLAVARGWSAASSRQAVKVAVSK